MKPKSNIAIKINIWIKPSNPNSRKLTAHGYIKITSTSKMTNKIATRKYLIEKGCLAFPTTSIPDSNELSLFAVLTFGPMRCVMMIVPIPNPAEQ